MANSATKIDRACRLGLQHVSVGGQKITGAATHHHGAPAERGLVYVCMSDYTWRQVPYTDVVITELSKGASSMVRKSAVQEELPGVEQEKVPALERLIRKYQNFKLERMEATKLEVASKTAVMEKMHELGLTVYKRPGHFAFKATLAPAGETLKVEEIDEDDPEESTGPVDDGEGDEE